MKKQDETSSGTTTDQPGNSYNGGNGSEEVPEAANGEDDGKNASSKSEVAEAEEDRDISTSDGEKDVGRPKTNAEASLDAEKSTITLYPYPPYPPYSYPPHFAMPPHGAAVPSNPMTSPANPHEYTDVSAMSDPLPDNRNRGGVSEIFPIKLHKMLEQTETEGLADVVSFFTHGRAFAIHKPRRFVAEVMNRFFRQSRFTSFQRQLNLYGFKRISQGPDNGGYYHELFLKDRPGLCVNMKRTRVKGNAKIRRDPDTEPNFYAFPPINIKGGQNAASGHSAPSNSASQSSRASPPPAPTTSPPTHMYPGYMYPGPSFPSVPPNAGPYTAAQSHRGGPIPPYTAAQQQKNAMSAVAAVYPYPPPFYSYPWYPPPGHAPPHLVARSPAKSPVMPRAEALALSPAQLEDSPGKVKEKAAV